MTDVETPDETDEERIDLRPTGLVRIFIEGETETKRYRLRRPFFGELKSMRLAAERIQEEVDDLIAGVSQRARELGEQAKALAEDTSLTDAEREQAEIKLKRAGREAGHDLTDKADQLRLEWWGDVFTTLSLDGTPDPLPGWVVDPALMPKLMNHWRTAPFRAVG